jgi:hypothetical protein
VCGRRPGARAPRTGAPLVLLFTLLLALPLAARDIPDIPQTEDQRRRSVRLVRRFPAAEAHQAVAVDAEFFYAIGSASIGKYEKSSGQRIGGWEEKKGGRVRHLNSGIVIGRWLYCAHSNYPEIPMVNSIEVFDTARMTHLRSIPLPRGRGSATWVERVDNEWWVAFAHYAGKGGEPGKGPEATTLVRFSDGWRPLRIWSFPVHVVSRWDGMSSSGGVWTGGRRFYTSGHHAPELYVLAVPDAGRELTTVEILGMESEGQGLAWDPHEQLLYSIQRRTREVLVSDLPGNP